MYDDSLAGWAQQARSQSARCWVIPDLIESVPRLTEPAAHLGIAIDGDQAQADSVLQLGPAHLRQFPRQVVVQPQLRLLAPQDASVRRSSACWSRSRAHMLLQTANLSHSSNVSPKTFDNC